MKRAAALAVVLVAGAVTGVGAIYPSGQAVTYSNFSYINDIAASMSQVFFATTEGIIRYNHIENRWEEPLTGTPGISEQGAEEIWVDQFGDHLYAKVFDGLYEYDEALDKWFPTSFTPNGNPFTSEAPPPPIMHAPPGFNYLSGDLIDEYGRRWGINEILEDGSGMYWMGIWGYGPAKARTTNLIIEPMPYGLLQRRVNALYRDSSYLWAGGAVFDEVRTGITQMNTENTSFQYIESGVTAEFPAVDVNCLEADGRFLYVGTPWGLYVLNRETRTVMRTIRTRDGLMDENVLSLEVVGDSVFLGTEEGLNLVVGLADTIMHVYPGILGTQRIWDIEHVDGFIWVGAESGAFRLTPGEERLQRFADPENVLFGDVFDIERSGRGLWFVSNEGLVELNLDNAESRSFHDITQRIMPRSLAVNETVAAVASDKGMTLLFHAESKPFKREFTEQDGLASNQVYALEMMGDYVWVGTDKGLTRFLWNNPDRVD